MSRAGCCMVGFKRYKRKESVTNSEVCVASYVVRGSVTSPIEYHLPRLIGMPRGHCSRNVYKYRTKQHPGNDPST